MPATRDQNKQARAIAFAALASRGLSRLAIQERLGISRSEFYRLKSANGQAQGRPEREETPMKSR